MLSVTIRMRICNPSIRMSYHLLFFYGELLVFTRLYLSIFFALNSTCCQKNTEKEMFVFILFIFTSTHPPTF